MLEGLTRDATANRLRAVGERLGEVGKRHPPTPWQQRVPHVAEAPPQPGGGGDGQSRDGGGDDPERYLAPRLRSRRISTAIGISESTITTMTTT